MESTMKMTYVGRTGNIFPHPDEPVSIKNNHILMTPLVKSVLEEAGAEITLEPDPWPGREGECQVIMGTVMPEGLIAVGLPTIGGSMLRMASEPPLPDEIIDKGYFPLDWTPCPECGAPLMWAEAGYVPGYRICSQPPHHHVMVEVYDYDNDDDRYY
jgi:hypothetical protein